MNVAESVLEAFYYDFAIHSRRGVFFVIDEAGGILEAATLAEMRSMLDAIIKGY